MEQVFSLDGVTYPVRVLALKRKFSLVETGISGRTQDGQMYRDLFGTYYHYTMTVTQQGENIQALDDFWEAISAPQICHVCMFPYGQKTLTQKMYVTAGEQALLRIDKEENHWGELQLDFVAMAPEVTP